ncbi:cystatin-F isoform X2 [Pristis pectinata]|uniref:cystatin-F isoform X2 n=1 Tax=Pristis pectinata TaxID=685728 RepID=UPI00223D1684|nr:cystatin-F isoform X2 [Pristis pectinata]
MGVVLEVIFTMFLVAGLAHSDEKSGNVTIGPGIPRDIDMNNPGAQNATLFAIYDYNNRSNDIYLFKVQRIHRAQVVAGLKYILHIDIGRTVCRKGKPYNFKSCSFQTSPPLIKTLACLFEVWVIPWRQIWRVIVMNCQ